MSSTNETFDLNLGKQWAKNNSTESQKSVTFTPSSGSFPQRHRIVESENQMRYDSTGMFHWCKPRRISEAQLTKEQCARLNLQVQYLS